MDRFIVPVGLLVAAVLWVGSVATNSDAQIYQYAGYYGQPVSYATVASCAGQPVAAIPVAAHCSGPTMFDRMHFRRQARVEARRAWWAARAAGCAGVQMVPMTSCSGAPASVQSCAGVQAVEFVPVP